MEYMDILSVLIRWAHIVAAILWIGVLFWFNWSYTPFAKTMEPDTMKKVVPELLPRALYFFRWGALWTWILGFMLLMIVFYHGGIMFDEGAPGWGLPSYVMVAVSFLFFPIYDNLAKSKLGKDIRVFGAIGFVLVAVISYLMIHWAQFSYRAYNIHIGAMFGTIMVANVWQRIWGVQKKTIPAIKAGNPPDMAAFATAVQRSQHNTYLTVPLVWTMIDAHTVVPGADSVLWLLGVILVGWLAVALLYRKSATVKGF
jgi:uncharacterized membrane protein